MCSILQVSGVQHETITTYSYIFFFLVMRVLFF